MEEGYRKSSKLHHYINIVENIIPSVHPTVQCRYNLEIYEFGIEMENVSSGISQDLMVERLIGNVMFRRNIRGYYRLVPDNTVHLSHNCHLFGTQGSLTFDFSIYLFIISLFFFFFSLF